MCMYIVYVFIYIGDTLTCGAMAMIYCTSSVASPLGSDWLLGLLPSIYEFYEFYGFYRY
jgi:hypothetical protein